MEPTHGLPPIKRLQAETLIKCGATDRTVQMEVSCCRATYYNYKRNIRLYGQSWAPYCGKIGRPSSFTQEMQDVSLLFILLD